MKKRTPSFPAGYERPRITPLDPEGLLEEVGTASAYALSTKTASGTEKPRRRKRGQPRAHR